MVSVDLLQPFVQVIEYRGQAPDWDAYLDAVYGSGSVLYPVDLRRFNWFYWSAPLSSAIHIYLHADARAKADISHFAPLGFTFRQPYREAPLERDGALWVEVMREDKPFTWENSKAGFWYYEARGSGIWLDLGRTLDYSCTMRANDQHWGNISHRNAYMRTCRDYGLIQKGEGRYSWLPRSDYLFGSFHRPMGLHTIQRWSTFDVGKGLSSSSRREVVDTAQRDATCGTQPGRCRRTRCCTCVGGPVSERRRHGWAAFNQSGCACDEFFRIRVAGYRHDGFLNCGRAAPPNLESLMRSPLGGWNPFAKREGIRLQVEALCNGSVQTYSVPSLAAFSSVRGLSGMFPKPKPLGCTWVRFLWPPALV
mmetsp:Transcript_39272/g.65176  ORF Transcript_39272/g.65176 Transcript_39272/m.65176 type:complete len:365 (+) Transcript_39272:34-1128(+)